MGDVINCTRLLSRVDNVVPLPLEPAKIPRIPLISFAYRSGCLLDIFGEKTSEQHMINALNQTIYHWKQQGISIDMCDFTTYPKLDECPSRYVIFLELNKEEQGNSGVENDYQQLQSMVSNDVERELCEVNHIYKQIRNSNQIGSIVCILVRNGTFSTFLHKELITDQISPIQVKPHRLLKNKHHIEFFYDRRLL